MEGGSRGVIKALGLVVGLAACGDDAAATGGSTGSSGGGGTTVELTSSSAATVTGDGSTDGSEAGEPAGLRQWTIDVSDGRVIAGHGQPEVALWNESVPLPSPPGGPCAAPARRTRSLSYPRRA